MKYFSFKKSKIRFYKHLNNSIDLVIKYRNICLSLIIYLNCGAQRSRFPIDKNVYPFPLITTMRQGQIQEKDKKKKYKIFIPNTFKRYIKL